MSDLFNFFEAVNAADVERLEEDFSSLGDLINTREPETGATAMHYVAAYNMRFVFNWLVKQPGLDYLVRDNRGRLPSALAFEVANNPAMGRYLASKQNHQAQSQGIDIRPLLAA